MVSRASIHTRLGCGVGALGVARRWWKEIFLLMYKHLENYSWTTPRRLIGGLYLQSYRMLFYCAILFHFYFSMFHNFSLLYSHISECFNLGNCWMSSEWANPEKRKDFKCGWEGEALEYNVMALMNIQLQHNNLHLKELKLYQSHFSDCIKLLERKCISP